MKVLLLGSTGQLGQAFIQQSGWQQWQSMALNRAQLDICDHAAVTRLMVTYQPDVVINCAAYTAVEQAGQQHALCMAVNVDALQHLAQQCQQHQALLIHFSTDYVFDGTKQGPYIETDTAAPLNVYGHSKLLGEQAIQQNCSNHLILRTSWLFSEFGHNFYRTMLSLAHTEQRIRVVNDQFGCPTYAGDLAAVVLQLLKRYQTTKQLTYGLYHLAGRPIVSWYQFACAIFAAHQITVPVQAISHQQWPSKVQRPANSALDSTKFTDTFDITMPSWHNALVRLAKGHI